MHNWGLPRVRSNGFKTFSKGSRRNGGLLPRERGYSAVVLCPRDELALGHGQVLLVIAIFPSEVDDAALAAILVVRRCARLEAAQCILRITALVASCESVLFTIRSVLCKVGRRCC